MFLILKSPYGLLLRVLKAMCLLNISLQLPAIWMFYLFGLKTSRKKAASDKLTA